MPDSAIQQNNRPAAPSDLRRAVVAEGIAAAGDRWHPLTGGRSNRLWKIETRDGPLVCKLYDREASTPLFPNDGATEHRVLTRLHGTGLAPRPVLWLQTPPGDCLIYHHVPGRTWEGDARAVGKVLARLHVMAPLDGLRRLSGSSAELRAAGRQLLSACADERASSLGALVPTDPGIGPARQVFLHGDAVPGNVIQNGSDLTLIDWQCPALGDPCEDLAMFMSPAMQHLSGRRPLALAEEAALLRAYGAGDTMERLAALRPLFHWRMAAYCLWKTERGDAAYEQAMHLEIAALRTIQ